MLALHLSTKGEAVGLAAVEEPQTSLEEKVVESSELESLLESREQARVKRADAQAAFKTCDEVVKSKLADLAELDDGVTVRVGRYRITQRAIEGRVVSFETSPSSRVTIAALDE